MNYEESMVAVEDGGKAKWVIVSMDDTGKVIDADTVAWTNDLNAYDQKRNSYPYWVGTT